MSANLLASLKENVQIVLVNTSHPGNIGAVARAMKNMGLAQLSLVCPSSFPSEEAVSRSSGADDLLASAAVVQSLDEAISDSQIVVGASARTRKMVWPLINPRACADLVLQSQSAEVKPKVSILFGREASGLTNEELQKCHYHVNIPANPDYASLNLAMAVQVVSYELRMSALQSDHVEDDDANLVSNILSPDHESWDGELASASEVEGFLGHLESTLIEIGYHDPNNPRMLMSRLRRLFQRAHMDKMEVNIMRGILKDILKGSR